MGQKISGLYCVNLADLPENYYEELMAENFTVIRTNGEVQPGWKIPRDVHNCHSNNHPWCTSHATNSYPGSKEIKQWKYHMVCGEGDDHVCGWRACEEGRRTFWPTRLTTQEEKEAWWANLDAMVATLKSPAQVQDEVQKIAKKFGQAHWFDGGPRTALFNTDEEVACVKAIVESLSPPNYKGRVYAPRFSMADGSWVYVTPDGKVITEPPISGEDTTVPFAYYGRKFLNVATTGSPE